MEDTFKYRVAQVMAGEYPERYNVPVCDTPELIQQVGFAGKKIVMEQKKLRRCLAPEETAPSGVRHHDLPIDFVDNLPHYVQNPAMVLLSHTHPNDSIVLVTDCKDKKEQPIIIALRDEGKRGVVDGEVVTYDKLASVYGKEDFAGFLERSIKAEGTNNGLLYWNEKKSRDLAVSAGLDLPRVLANHDPNVIIRRYNENVNPLSQNNLDFSPDGYGTTLPRPDKQPFAYSDPDGRQKVYEYIKDRNGKEVLGSTTATFSDGRSEITKYDERGAVTRIERKDVHGRTTYLYSSDGYGYHDYEESIGYFNVDPRNSFEPNAHKSEHIKEHDKEEQRGIYYDKYKENWNEYDGNDNRTLYKRNVYRDDGMTPDKYYCEERQSEYNRHGQCTSSIDKDRNGTRIVKHEYYTADEWFDYYNLTPEDTDGEYERPQKSRTCLSTDGRLSIEKYEISGEHTEVEYSSSGKITRFRDGNGRSYNGQAAQLEYFKSMGGKAPTFKEVAAATNALRSSATPKNKNAGKPNGKPTGSGGNRGSGSSGAGR